MGLDNTVASRSGTTRAGDVPVDGAAVRGLGERPFWSRVGAVWRQLGGGLAEAGFSFEWHEWVAELPVPWAGSFHPGSVEICLNLDGVGWVARNGTRMEFRPDTAGFFGGDGGVLRAERGAGCQHRFLSVEYSIEFLRRRLSGYGDRLHAGVRRCLDEGPGWALVSAVRPITHRQRELAGTLLHPPVRRAAQRLWYESKALEFAAEFLFAEEGEELLCTRAQRVARERVARAQALLEAHLAEPPSLEELGRRVGCSHFYLSRTFRQETGMTMSQWLRRKRLERAAALLRSGRCNVTEAALEVGYSSLSHFSQAFHEQYQCCPGLYPVRTPTQRVRSEDAVG